ncbi:unnamed protein product (macronuclear) [Paramecium tetraurelia]|uniref:Uncharacterized protein n=1 Tax=Paramecium tetraurelia TaxID=5888 RepID=A0D792_PARTE|nr:uncharacterized protein GSPATT00001951001 [Paramecium tetraurelia]CAK78909.1 unnamed protein product [Paramecium tetraurelia]|eukprot:XP_001446306.1 hypothetical protein (macronuclear) [Paramecium tetraurelia strain d4-2]
MDQIQVILVKEHFENDCTEIRFLVNNQEVLPKISIKLIEDYSEEFSSALYKHLLNHVQKECRFLYFNEPLECKKQKRFNLISQLGVDVILKILNLNYIPIIRTNYSRYILEDVIFTTQPFQKGKRSVIEKLNQSWETQCRLKSKITKEFLQIIEEFKFYYRIDILITSNFKPIKQEKYSDYDVLYVPTEELIFLKTNKKQQLSLLFQNLEQIIKHDQLI